MRPARSRARPHLMRGAERGRGFCSARLQAGICSNPRRPPEGGRYTPISAAGGAFACVSALWNKPLRLGARRAKADLGHFAFGRSAQLEKFTFLEISHARDEVG